MWHRQTAPPPSLSHTNNLPSPGRVTNSRAPVTSEFLSKFVLLINVPCPQKHLYIGYLIHARILSGHTFWPYNQYRDLVNRQNTYRMRTSRFRITSPRLLRCSPDTHTVRLYFLLCLPQVITLPVRICLTYPSSPYVSPPVIFVVEDPYIDGFASYPPRSNDKVALVVMR